MVFFLFLGAILGAATVIFAFQNVEVITVNLMTWQITAPLAFVLLGTLLCGILMTLLVLLPSLLRDEMYLKTIKRQKRELEDEFAKFRTANNVVVADTTTTETTRVVV